MWQEHATTEITVASFNETLKKFEDDLNKKVARLALATQGEVQLNTPVDTGRLRSSIVAEQDSDGSWFVGTAVEYAEQVEIGMKPTVIRPVNKKALKFTIGDKVIFAKKVNHPGFPGAHMFQRALSTIPSNAEKIFKD